LQEKSAAPVPVATVTCSEAVRFEASAVRLLFIPIRLGYSPALLRSGIDYVERLAEILSFMRTVIGRFLVVVNSLHHHVFDRTSRNEGMRFVGKLWGSFAVNFWKSYVLFI
jgi:hypothetical protein